MTKSLNNNHKPLVSSFLAQMVKESTCNAGDLGSIPGLRRSPGGVNDYPLQYSHLENSMNKGRKQRVRWLDGLACSSPWGHKESDMT